VGPAGVTNSNRVQLRVQLVENYESLIRRLTRKLGSSDSARETLHETFLRLERAPEATEIKSPADYIFRAAINVAKDRQKSQNSKVSRLEIDELLEVRDEAPDPAQIVEARSDIMAFKRALSELPERPRTVLEAILVEGQAPREVSERLGVSLRTVEGDLKLALSHCAGRLQRSLIQRLGGPRPRS
jgi:RNA polymerase sigma-70 factor, ECF subfamily